MQLIVIVFDPHVALTPAGKPVVAPIPVAPVVRWVLEINTDYKGNKMENSFTYFSQKYDFWEL